MILDKVQNFLNGEDGASAIEYAIVAGVISIVIIGAATTIGGALITPFTTVSTAFGS